MSFVVGTLLSLFSALFKTSKSVTTKLTVSEIDEYTVVWAYRIVALFIFTLLVGFTNNFFVPRDSSYWIALGINAIVYSSSAILITKAYKVSDVSIVAPLLAFVPLFVTLPAWVILNERPSPIAFVGILLVTIGAYSLQLHTRNEGYLEPLKSIYYDQGARYIAIALLLISIAPSMDKIGISATSPLLWIFSTHMGTASILFVVMFKRNRNTYATEIQDEWKTLVLLGISHAGIGLTQFYAYEHINVAYVQSIKQASLILTIIAGGIVFDEEHVKERLLGGAIILLGIVLILLTGA